MSDIGNSTLRLGKGTLHRTSALRRAIRSQQVAGAEARRFILGERGNFVFVQFWICRKQKTISAVAGRETKAIASVVRLSRLDAPRRSASRAGNRAECLEPLSVGAAPHPITDDPRILFVWMRGTPVALSPSSGMEQRDAATPFIRCPKCCTESNRGISGASGRDSNQSASTREWRWQRPPPVCRDSGSASAGAIARLVENGDAEHSDGTFR